MGYSTYFTDEFETNKEMSDDLIEKINTFSKSRHCNGNGYPNDHSGFPGYWCDWVATSSKTIGWDGAEKFYDYDEWLVYIIKHFLEPNGILLNGEVYWEGEESDDFGILLAEDNRVYVRYGIKEYADKKLVE